MKQVVHIYGPLFVVMAFFLFVYMEFHNCMSLFFSGAMCGMINLMVLNDLVNKKKVHGGAP